MEPELADVRDFLAAHAPFEALGSAELERLARRLEVRYARRGAALPGPGAAPGELYVLRSGAAEIEGPDGPADRLGEGESFGGGPEPEPRVRALEDVLLYVVPAAELQRLRAAHPAIELHLGRSHAERLRAALEGRRTEADRSLFTTPLRSLLRRPTVGAEAVESVREAARRMRAERVSSLLVFEEGGLAGIVTDRDLRSRVVAEGLPPDTPLREVMTRDLVTLPPDAYAFELMLTMTRHRIHHVPVVDGARVLGMLTSTDLTRLQTASPVFLARDIAEADGVDAVARAARRRRELFLALAAADASAHDLGRILASVTDAVTRRLLELAEARLGPAPAPWCWLALGSQARREGSVHSDQDHALILGDGAGEAHDGYFGALARAVADGLAAAGYPYCPGEVMASTPAWRQDLAGWRETFARWFAAPSPEALLRTTIFFDLRPVAGDRALAERLQATVLERSPRERIFLAHLTRHALDRPPPIGFFRQFVLRRRGEHARTIDLKHDGIAPIVDLARVHALAAGLPEAATADRLAAAAERGALSRDGARDLRDALEFVSIVRAQHQAALLRRGEEPDDHVAPQSLSPFERRHLRDAFRVVANAQQALSQRFHAGMLGE